MPVTVPAVAVYAGDTVDWPTLTFLDGNGNPRDLVAEGWTNWEAQWRTTVTSGSSIELIVDVSEANAGIINIQASATQTRSMGNAGVWDLQAINGAVVRTWAVGKTTYTQDVTHV
jgi:hypothetical protein